MITIILTTYNRPHLLRRAISSILVQEIQDWELIVVNDHGEDVSEIVTSFNDNRIKYIYKEKNEGLGAARNTGIEYANGKYVNFLDDDDYFYPHHLTVLLKFFEDHPEQKIAYTDAVYHIWNRDANNNQEYIENRVIPYSVDYVPDMLLYQNITPVLCVMFELNDITRNIKLDESARVYEDWLFWLELTKHYSMNHIAIPTCVVTFKKDGSTMSSSRNEFTTMLPGIFRTTIERAQNKVMVANIMNQILQQRGLQPMFRIEQSG